MSTDQATVAIYWDFENIHASLFDQKSGSGSYNKSARFASQEKLVNVEALMDFAASIGSVAINRAYGNWQYFSKYKDVLLHNAVELIQLFPPGASAKNGADIKLCIDVTEDIIRFPHITTIVIVGGDSDFLPISQKIKAAGKTLVGIGSKASTNKHWAHSCHEFKYYEQLIIDDIQPEPVISELQEEATTTLTDPADLIRRAISRLSGNKGDPWVLKATIRPMIKRLDPTFDEQSYGAKTFSEFLKLHTSIFEVRKGEHDQEYRLKERPHE
jgi:uncharacterized protein (TIGR00288 family)